jgi:fatty acid desaturase
VQQFLGDVPLYPRSTYVAELRAELPAETMAPAHSRLLLIPIYVAVVATLIMAIARGWVPWPLVPVLSLALGAVFACLTFVAHETLHGGITRNKLLQRVVGWIGFAPFMLSPRLWVAWHNSAHHANTQLEHDPDCYATLDRYQSRASTRFSVDAFSLGGRRWRGALSLILGFTVQSADQLFSAHRHGILTRREHVLAFAESALGVALWAVVAYLVGFVAFVFVFVIPLLVANACVMAFILTNHSLSPRLPINDPLVGSLSVTTSRFIDWITLRFGLHVEHHMFPAMSSRHAHAVRSLIQTHWPERYQSMPLRSALRALHRTARVYKDATTLLDPKTGREYPTLLPRHTSLTRS